LFAIEQSGWDNTYKTATILKQVLKLFYAQKAKRILNKPSKSL
jgi:hypothetical protein